MRMLCWCSFGMNSQQVALNRVIKIISFLASTMSGKPYIARPKWLFTYDNFSGRG
jgi:hypothetical protein